MTTGSSGKSHIDYLPTMPGTYVPIEPHGKCRWCDYRAHWAALLEHEATKHVVPGNSVE